MIKFTTIIKFIDDEEQVFENSLPSLENASGEQEEPDVLNLVNPYTSMIMEDGYRLQDMKSILIKIEK